MNNAELVIMEVERFAIHDGPGIRTTVFLKSCPLRCQWCANPESQQLATLLMHYDKKCTSCGRCVRVCPNEAIRWQDNRVSFDRAQCLTCKKCQAACLNQAIVFSGYAMSIDNIIAEVLRDKEYYDTSGGGITLSGGEPFAQFPGALQLLMKSKAHKLHTVVETCGYVKQAHLEEALSFVDLFLFDIKHIKADKFKQFTGGELSVITKNLTWLASIAPDKVLPRIPVIPKFNHSKEEVGAIFDFLKSIGLSKVCLLPYHSYGSDKYEQLGRTFAYASEESLQGETLAKYIKLGEEKGLIVQVGA